MSAHQNTIAAADSSDNNPPTSHPSSNEPQSYSSANSPYSGLSDIHYPSYYYDQYYHGMEEYGSAQITLHSLNEPSSDILDLDSQKMVYPAHVNGALPPIQSMQHHPMMREHDSVHHHYHHQSIKTEPKENDSPSSSLLPSSLSLTNCKPKEALRPKTYNCTACNKWFTSSGHLKRHYNTTLHKNGVKSSGQPDPASLPISAHHHPHRDPNYVVKRRSHHQQPNQQLQQLVPLEPPRSLRKYQSHFTLPSFSSGSSATASHQDFQQYGTNLHNTSTVSPNTQPLPSMHPPYQHHTNSLSSFDTLLYDIDEQMPQSVMTTTEHIQTPTQEQSVSTTSSLTSDYRCNICDKVFNKSCYLTQHNKTFHCGDKPFKCQQCGKRFPCAQSHAEHFAKHGGEKPFKCEVCPKAFNYKTDLRRHMCLHSGCKPYTCQECGKGFIRKDHMVKHMDTHKKKLIRARSNPTSKKKSKANGQKK